MFLHWNKCSIPSLAHQWILCSEWVPSETVLFSHLNSDVHLYLLIEMKQCFYWIKLVLIDGSYSMSLKMYLMDFIDFFFLQTLFTSQDITGLEWCGLLVDYCDVFISCLYSRSDGTHSLQRISWWASNLKLLSPNLMTKQTHLHSGRPEGESILSKCSFLGEQSFSSTISCLNWKCFALQK